MRLVVLRGMNLNTLMYRGYAPVADLARISAPDSYNQDTNPNGLQRDLSEKHSRDAYRYADGAEKVQEHKRAWTEILLNVRDPSVATLTPIDEPNGVFAVEIREDRINKNLPSPQISRTDGNHRLFFGEGDPKHPAIFPPLTVTTPFALTMDLDPDAEAYVFMDINDNQKTMNTAHLAHMKARLTGDEKLAQEDPALWIAEHLSIDPKSPWHGIVYKGGSKRSQGLKRRVNLPALRTGISMMLHDAVKLRDMQDLMAQYGLIRLYWNAVANVYASEWNDPTSMVLKGIGIWAFSQLGAAVIDRCLVRSVAPGALEGEMVQYLRQTRPVYDWRKGGDIQGYGGQQMARDAANQMKRALSDEDIHLSQIAAAMRNMI
jgi:DGQHR domain-containing protein